MYYSTIRASVFEPLIEIAAGTVVTWTNEDGVPHTVTADNLSFDSPFFTAGQTYSRQFSEPGNVTYYCRVHAGMTGTVSVSPTPGTPQ